MPVFHLQLPPPNVTTMETLTVIHLSLLRCLHDLEVLGKDFSEFDPMLFYQGRVNFYDSDRIGGLLSYVQKEFPVPSPEPNAKASLEFELFDTCVCPLKL